MFIFSDTLDGPIWMIRPLFISNCVLVTLNYVIQKIFMSRKDTVWLYITVLLLLGFGIFNYSLSALNKYLYVFVSCLCGFFVRNQTNTNNKQRQLKNINKILSLILVVAVFFFLTFQDTLFLLEVFTIRLYSIWNIIYGLILFIGIGLAADSYKSNMLLTRIAKLSFPVYLLHWPVICSVGSNVLVQMEFNRYIFMITTLVISVNITVIVLSVLYQMLYNYLLKLERMIKIICNFEI